MLSYDLTGRDVQWKQLTIRDAGLGASCNITAVQDAQAGQRSTSMLGHQLNSVRERG